MLTACPFTADALKLDAAAEVERIVSTIRAQVRRDCHRRGAVLGLSGGIDSSVCVALCARAFGPEKVLGILMPERDSADESLELGQFVGAHFGVPTVIENVGPLLDAAGCYRRRDEAIQSVIPEYRPNWKSKIVLSSLHENQAYRIFSVVVQSPTGERQKARLPLDAYHTIVAATNFKQRSRKMMEYYHADRLNFAVCGTPNRLEYDQGFFVKNGDGAADFKPIAHLYKTQVYQLAEYLGVPADIRRRPPTTDTYSLEQSQEEFFFSLPYDKLDLCLYGKNHGLAPEDIAPAVGVSAADVALVYRDIDAKRRVASYLHAAPMVIA